MSDTRLGRSRVFRGMAAALVLAGVTGVVGVATAGGAAAAVTTVVQAHSGTDAGTVKKSAVAQCPAGTRVFGGGGDIVGGGHGVALTGTAPLGIGAAVGNGTGHVVLNALLGNYTRNAFGQLTGFASAGAFVGGRG